MNIDSKFFENLSEKLSAIIPDSLHHLRQDFKKNIEAVLQVAFEKLNLVTREEFDVQVRLLQSAREKLTLLEEKINSLETIEKTP